MVDAMGWSIFFLATIVIGIPGLVMLGRFVPIGVRDPDFENLGSRTQSAPSQASGLLAPGLMAAAVLTVVAALLVALLDAMQAMRGTTPMPFDFGAAVVRLTHPADVNGWVQIVGILAFALVGGMFIAAARVRKTAEQRADAPLS
jgi:PAT family beta-lactamase induction signal transducer AmpG